ncbi:hemerythrin domain-containing protein [Arthrobacter sp. efr-133-TYG-104]|uniref:hemerythrin domain-containing protein n=1 Tax=Arthrobacter sp. efr-133-TYG-104 TaxID=3040324 RepID=UPI0025509A7E|nr:hemerythrin domain-containing protein [Arthrobacter sp. efr-133-TYG-104]
MVTRHSSTGNPSLSEARGCDTSGLIVIHTMFRRLFTDAPRLVREVASGDTERSKVIGNHIAEIVSGLHHHHQGEDLLLWDRLESRSPACAIHVKLMRSQHASVAALLEQLDTAVPVWQRSAAPEDGAQVAALLDEVRTVLFVHLGQEEELILPAASTSLSQREWDELGEYGMAGIPKNRLMINLGFVLEAFSPEERSTWMKANVPGIARALYGLFGRRQYASHYRRVYGTMPS